MIIHLILFKNVDAFDQIFFKSTQEWGERLPIKRWIRVWKNSYPFSNVIYFYNDFVYPILKMIGLVIERILRSVRKVVKPKI